MMSTVRPSLLIVDDEADILQAVAAYLEDVLQDVRVTTARSAAEALQIVARRDFDIVLSDFRMPDMDGLAFLTEMRRRYPQVTRVMMTAYPDDGIEGDARKQAGVVSFLSKPLDLDRLTATVEDTLAARADAGS